MATAAFGPPTIGPARFGQILAGSPVLAERPALEYYAAICGYGLDPAFMLAIFAHESQCGTAPAAVVNRYGTKNWGNTRSLSLPGVAVSYADTDRGRFVRFPDWLTGLRDACDRLANPAYPYAKAKARTAEAILPIWAPPDDQGNDTAAYLADVLAKMAAWKEIVPVANTFADVVDLLPEGFNRPGDPLNGFHAFVVHETDNEAAGANAAMHSKYIRTGDRSALPSFHFVADSAQSIQCLPAAPGVAEVGWHIGDGADQPYHDEAFYTVGGEICVNSRAGFPAACRNMAAVAARVLKAYNLAVLDGVTLRQHGSYWSKENPTVHQGCPKHLKANDWGVSWAGFVAMVQQEYSALSTPVAAKAISAPPDEAAAARAFGDGLPFLVRGNLLREGEADLTGFSGGKAERVCLYEKIVTHRLNGADYVLSLELWDKLRASNQIHIYPAMPW